MYRAPDGYQSAPKFKHTKIQMAAVDLIVNHRHSLLVGGAGSGKTLIALSCVILRAMKKPSRHLIVRQGFNHVKTSIWHESMPEILKLRFPGLKIREHKSDFFWSLPNGSEIWIGGTDSKERLDKILGRGLSTIQIEEASQVSFEAFEILRTRLRQKSGLKLRVICTCNPPNKSHWTYKYFIQKVDIRGVALKNPDVVSYLYMNPADNAENLPSETIDELQSLSGKAYQRFWKGEFNDDTEGALFKDSWINENRCEYRSYEQLVAAKVKIAVTAIGVDPASSKTETSDLTGIVACAIGAELKNGKQQGYVLGDYSLKGTPKEWALQAIKAYHDFDADMIVIETNQGGDMAVDTLRNAGFKGKIVKVHASKSKKSRAEPISALYEQGFISHLQDIKLANLESEMTSYVPFQCDASPDRMDAMVWAMHHLFSNDNHYKFLRQISQGNIRQAIGKRAGWKVK